MNLKLGELFCGAGGIGLGAKMARSAFCGAVYDGYETVWATDYDKVACSTYRSNLMPDGEGQVFCEDIKDVDFEGLKSVSDVDVLSFGFPCNDFSIIGKQKGLDGEFGLLYTYCVKALDVLRPKFFLAENVGGLRGTDGGRTLNLILNEFVDVGYRVVPHLYKFEEYGVPQARHRVMIVCGSIPYDGDKVLANACVALPDDGVFLHEHDRFTIRGRKKAFKKRPTEKQFLTLIKNEGKRRVAEIVKLKKDLLSAKKTKAKERLASFHAGNRIMFFDGDELKMYTKKEVSDYNKEYDRRVALKQEIKDKRLVESKQASESRAKRRKERNASIAVWAALNGSERLRGQIALGGDGYQLYLEERVHTDFLGFNVHLFTGFRREECKNPKENITKLALRLREKLISMGYESPELVIGEELCLSQLCMVVAFDGYRPGGGEEFDRLSVAFSVKRW